MNGFYGIAIGGNGSMNVFKATVNNNSFDNRNSIKIFSTVDKVLVSNNILSASIVDESGGNATLNNNI